MDTPRTLDGAALLPHWGVLRARGADAAKFLHGQLTADMLKLGSDRAQLAGFCSAKGRLQASFVAWRNGPEELLLACAASVLPATLKRLSMFVLRAQCKLDDATAATPLLGLAGTAAAARLGELAVWSCRAEADGSTTIRLPDAAGLRRALVAGGPAWSGPQLPLDAWRWLEVRSGVPVVEAATVDQFVPQMVNLELLGGVDFKKGCYPGQEVVARSQYRGTLKRRMFGFDAPVSAAAGQEVFHSADPQQPAGLVANAAADPGGHGSALLVELKLSALDGGTLHLGTAQGPTLQRAPLPYDVPLDTPQSA